MITHSVIIGIATPAGFVSCFSLGCVTASGKCVRLVPAAAFPLPRAQNTAVNNSIQTFWLAPAEQKMFVACEGAVGSVRQIRRTCSKPAIFGRQRLRAVSLRFFAFALPSRARCGRSVACVTCHTSRDGYSCDVELPRAVAAALAPRTAAIGNRTCTPAGVEIPGLVPARRVSFASLLRVAAS